MTVLCGLHMKRDDVGARLGKRLNLRLGVLHHKVHIEDGICHLAQALHYGRADGDIRHERAIHNIDMHILRTSIRNLFHLVGQMGEVGGKDRGSNFNHLKAFFLAVSISSSILRYAS